MNSTHCVKIVRIPDEIEKHPNADTLGLVRFGGYQVVVKLGDFKPGDLAIYLQPDSVVPEEPQYAFLWDENEYPEGVPERKRRITVKKLRKEWSEGLLLPIEIDQLGWGVIRRRDGAVGRVEEGDDVAKFLGITHYNPPEPTQSTANHNYDKGVWPKSLKGWFYFILRKLGWDLNGSTGGDNERAPKSFPPVYDVEGFKNFPHAFGPEDQVVITEKIHGSNARYTFQNKKMYVGSRQLWKSPKSNCVWRKALLQNPWIEDWCRAHPGYTIFGEVFPTQKFKGGATVDYGRKPGEVGFLAFDILTPDGEWTAEGHGITSDKWVPVLYCGPFDEKIARTLAEGKSQVTGANHIREGCVIRGIENKHIRGLGRPMLKIVSNTFLEQS